MNPRDFGDLYRITGRKRYRCEYCYVDFQANLQPGDDPEFTPGSSEWPQRIKDLVIAEKAMESKCASS